VNDSTANEIARRFGRDLVELHLRAGTPSYSALEIASKHHLRRATLSDRLNGKRAGLPDWPFVFTFVSACRALAEGSGLDLEDLGTVADWKQRWDSAKRGIIDARFPGRSRQQPPLPQPSRAENAAVGASDEMPEQHALLSPHEGNTVWGPVPLPIIDFVGRQSFLDDLHRRLTQDNRTGALTIQGVAGIGKTQLAAEYARRHRSEYDLVWWISCATQNTARSGMTELASRLGATEPLQAQRENQLTDVFDKLQLSRRYARWLLIFDGANEPEEIRNLLPPERQNALITSRNYEWSATSNMLDLDVFKRSESVEFLRQRRRGLREAEAHRIADALGDLPLALEHAVESPFQVADYLSRLENSTLDLFSDNRPSAYPDTVAGTWRKAIDTLRADAPDAMGLLRCLAFFGSDPIPRECMERGGYNQVVSLHQVLRDPIRFIRAIGTLRRMGLLSIRPGSRPDTSMFHVHRLTQCLVRDNLSAAETERSRHDVHLLIAAAAPANPDDPDSWFQYEELRGHMSASGVVESDDMSVRLLVINFVRYLCASGDPKAAMSLAHDALERWVRAGTGEPALEEINLAMHRAEAETLCSLGAFHDAFEVYRGTPNMMLGTGSRWSEEITALSRIAGTRLRTEGNFVAALAADMEAREQHIAVFGRDHPQTFIAMHNLSVDHALNGHYARAVSIAKETYSRCHTFYGYPDHPSILFQQNALARCKHLSGERQEALQIMGEVNMRYLSITGRKILEEDHPWFLLHRIDFAAARRDSGLSGTALGQLTEEMHRVYLHCWQTLGIDHPLTLASAITRGTLLRRMPERLNEAAELVSDTQRRYVLTLGQHHPYVYACATLLASINRQLSSAIVLQTQVEDSSDFTPLPFCAP
jgi:NB-ARC domain/Tetratricopeptide repeat